MDSNAKSKWQVRLAVLLLFVVGFIAGGLAMNIYRSRQWSPRAGGRGGFEQMLDKLNLTSDQRTEISGIFEDARKQLTELRKESEPRFRDVRKNTDERLQSVLTPEQWEQFQQMTDRRRNRTGGRPRREGGRP
ncbi:MAG: periplasmic heavy metal sensor [Acidobacteriota bacterium]